MPLGMGGGMGFAASNAIGKATRDSVGGGEVTFFCHFEAEVEALALAPDLFFENAPPRVFTILEV